MELCKHIIFTVNGKKTSYVAQRDELYYNNVDPTAPTKSWKGRMVTAVLTHHFGKPRKVELRDIGGKEIKDNNDKETWVQHYEVWCEDDPTSSERLLVTQPFWCSPTYKDHIEADLKFATADSTPTQERITQMQDDYLRVGQCNRKPE